jgi:hypothetical protein
MSPSSVNFLKNVGAQPDLENHPAHQGHYLLSKAVAGPILDGIMRVIAVFDRLSRSNKPGLNSQDDNVISISSLMH